MPIRHGLCLGLSAEPAIRVIGQAVNSQEALEMVAHCAPHVLIIDLDLPEMDSLGLAKKVRAAFPRTAVILVTIEDDAFVSLQAKQAGTAAVLSKLAPFTDLLAVVKQVAAGTRRIYIRNGFPIPPFKQHIVE